MQPKINNTIIDLKARQLTGLCKQSAVTSAAFEGPTKFSHSTFSSSWLESSAELYVQIKTYLFASWG